MLPAQAIGKVFRFKSREIFGAIRTIADVLPEALRRRSWERGIA